MGLGGSVASLQWSVDGSNSIPAFLGGPTPISELLPPVPAVASRGHGGQSHPFPLLQGAALTHPCMIWDLLRAA